MKIEGTAVVKIDAGPLMSLEEEKSGKHVACRQLLHH